MKNNNTALYIGADPFTFNDLEIVRKTIDTFGFANILLDRKNRDAEYEEYLLNYADRADIIKHDLDECGLREYRIYPIDETLEKLMREHGINTLILNFDYQASIDFRMMKILQRVNPGMTIMLVRGENYIEPKFIKTLLDADSSMDIYRNFCSDYSFKKLKVKTMTKIGLTGMIGCSLDECGKAFEEHGYTVVDVDEFMRGLYADKLHWAELSKKLRQKGINPGSPDKGNFVRLCLEDAQANNVFQQFVFQKISRLVGDSMMSVFNDRIVVKFSMLCEFGMEGAMDRSVCLNTPAKEIERRLGVKNYTAEYIAGLNGVQMPISEKLELCDFVVDDSSAETAVSHTVRLLNGRLKEK